MADIVYDLDVLYSTPTGDGSKDLSITMYSANRSELSVTVQVHQLSSEVKSTLYKANRKDIRVTTSIPDHSTLTVEYSIPSGDGELNVTSKVYTANRSELVTSVYILPHSKDLASTTEIPYRVDMQTTTNIPANSTFDVAYTIVQPPTTIEYLSPVKDTFTSSLKPKSYYGDRPSLIVGNSAFGEYRAYLSFDISSFVDSTNMILYKALLSLFTNTSIPDSTINVYECLTDWDEYALAWRDNVLLGELVGTTKVSSIAKISVQKLINKCKAEGKRKLNLCITSNSYVSFSSREGELAPKLTIAFAQADWEGLVGRSEMTSTVVIPESIDLNCTVSKGTKMDLYSSVYRYYLGADIKDRVNDTLYGHVEWVRPRLDLPSTLYKHLYETTDTEIYNTLIIRNKGNKDIECNLSIGRITDLSSTIYIMDNINLYSSSTVFQKDKEKDLEYKALVGYDIELYSSVTARQTVDSDLYGTELVNKTYFKELDSIINTNAYSDLSSTILLKYATDMYSEVTSKREGSLDLNSMFKLWHNYELPSTLTLRLANELYGSISVNKTYDKDLNMSYNLMYYSYLNTTLYVPSQSNLYTSLSVVAYENSDMDSMFKLSHYNDLYSTVVPRINSDLYTTLNSNSYRNEDLENVFTVKYFSELYSTIQLALDNDIESTVFNRKDYVTDLNSSFGISRNLDMHSTLLTRLSNDLDGIVNIPTELNIDSVVTVRQKDSIELTSTLEIAHSVNKLELYSTLISNNYKDKDLEVSYDVRHFSELYSTIQLTLNNDIESTLVNNRLYNEDLESTVLLGWYNELYSTFLPRLYKDLDGKVSMPASEDIAITLVVRQEDVLELASTILVDELHNADMYVTIDTIPWFYSFLKVKVMVNTTSKRWTPPKPAGRLPREWKRKDFIQEEYIPALPPNYIKRGGNRL